MTRRLRAPDAGVAGVLVLALSAVLALVASLAVALASVGVARHQAASAADLAALAAADRHLEGSGPACAAAARVVDRALGDTGELLRCALLEREQVEVTVQVRPPGVLGTLGRAGATARAGP